MYGRLAAHRQAYLWAHNALLGASSTSEKTKRQPRGSSAESNSIAIIRWRMRILPSLRRFSASLTRLALLPRRLWRLNRASPSAASATMPGATTRFFLAGRERMIERMHEAGVPEG